MKIVLASGSPRRRELLSRLGLSDFLICPPEGGEALTDGLEPGQQVMRLSAGKAAEIAPLCSEDDLILAADTLVFVDGHALGKPRDREDAAAMLRALSGRSHEVYTGVTLRRGGRMESAFEKTTVFFRTLSETEIASYISSGEPMDKAGAYGAQEKGALLIERIEGDFYNVMGLPVCLVGRLFSTFGMDLLG